jgi:hypothetical protein
LGSPTVFTILCLYLTLEREREKEAIFEEWLSASHKASETQRSGHLIFQEASPPDWIVDHPVVQGWLKCDPEFTNSLWLSGTRGFGKSGLAAFLASNAINGELPVCFFFKNKKSLKAGHDLVMALACQLSRRYAGFRERMRQLWEEDNDIRNKSLPISQFFDKIMVHGFLESSGVSQSPPIHIIIDGLNECPRPAGIRSALYVVSRLPTLSSQQIRTLVTCQPTYELTNALKDFTEFVLDGSMNNSTIDKYLEVQLDESLSRRFQEEKIDPYTFLGERHHGMFLWVYFTLESLRSADSRSDFVSIIENTSGPREIEKDFGRGLKRLSFSLSAQSKVWVKQILYWIATAEAELSFDALETGVRLTRQIERNESEPDKLYDWGATLSRCGAFVRKVKIRGVVYVDILHDSFRSYIT